MTNRCYWFWCLLVSEGPWEQIAFRSLGGARPTHGRGRRRTVFCEAQSLEQGGTQRCSWHGTAVSTSRPHVLRSALCGTEHGSSFKFEICLLKCTSSTKQRFLEIQWAIHKHSVELWTHILSVLSRAHYSVLECCSWHQFCWGLAFCTYNTTLAYAVLFKTSRNILFSTLSEVNVYTFGWICLQILELRCIKNIICSMKTANDRVGGH